MNKFSRFFSTHCVKCHVCDGVPKKCSIYSLTDVLVQPKVFSWSDVRCEDDRKRQCWLWEKTEWWMGRRLRSERAGMGMITKWAGVRERTGRLALSGTLGEAVLFTYHYPDCIFIQGRSLWFTPKDTSFYRCECRAGECVASSIWLLQGNIFM